jgi:gp16 family phage-associated protein
MSAALNIPAAIEQALRQHMPDATTAQVRAVLQDLNDAFAGMQTYWPLGLYATVQRPARAPATAGSAPVMTAEQIKTRFRQQGQTFSSWTRANGYTPNKVIRVLNGFDKGNYGLAHEIAVKLGLKRSS